MYLYPLLWHEVKTEGTWFRNKRYGIYHVGRNVTKLVFGVSNKARSNQPAKLQGLARNLKFRLLQVMILHFPISELTGAEQSGRMRRLVCAFVVSKLQKTGFLALRPMLLYTFENLRY